MCQRGEGRRRKEGMGREGKQRSLSPVEARTTSHKPSSIWHLFIHALHIRIRRDKTLQISQPEDVAQCRISDSQSAPKQQQRQQLRTGQAGTLLIYLTAVPLLSLSLSLMSLSRGKAKWADCLLDMTFVSSFELGKEAIHKLHLSFSWSN